MQRTGARAPAKLLTAKFTGIQASGKPTIAAIVLGPNKSGRQRPIKKLLVAQAGAKASAADATPATSGIHAASRRRRATDGAGSEGVESSAPRAARPRLRSRDPSPRASPIGQPESGGHVGSEAPGSIEGGNHPVLRVSGRHRSASRLALAPLHLNGDPELVGVPETYSKTAAAPSPKRRSSEGASRVKRRLDNSEEGPDAGGKDR
jgi:hypothetical protein